MSEPTNPTKPTLDTNAPPSRSFVDADGGHWLVYEQAYADYDRRSGVSLIFNSDSAVRRVRHFPANWLELSDAELLALSWKA